MNAKQLKIAKVMALLDHGECVCVSHIYDDIYTCCKPCEELGCMLSRPNICLLTNEVMLWTTELYGELYGKDYRGYR